MPNTKKSKKRKNKIIRCPICRSKKIEIWPENFDPMNHLANIHCQNCGAVSPEK